MTEQNKTTTIPLPVQGKDIDSIMQSLESGVEELFTSNRYQEFLKTMAKFHNYSFNNTMADRYAATGCHTCYQLQKLAVHG